MIDLSRALLAACSDDGRDASSSSSSTGPNFTVCADCPIGGEGALEPVPAGKTGEVLFFELPAAELADVQPVITRDGVGNRPVRGRQWDRVDAHSLQYAWIAIDMHRSSAGGSGPNRG